MRTLRAIWRGCGYVEGYGHHPGTAVLIALLLLGALVGWYGFLAMLLIWGPFYLYGAYERGKN